MFKGLFGSKIKINAEELDPTKMPKHVAIIMDGNGRWAQKRGLPRTAGHQAGVQSLKQICYACGDLGVKHLTVYAFSTENWHRPSTEVNFLMELFRRFLRSEIQELEKKNVQVKFLGRKAGVDAGLLEEIVEVEKRTDKNDGLILRVCFNYGGRAEIVDAVREMIEKGMAPEEIDEERVRDFLYTRGLPDVELVIRTSGEQRLSNFLLYQSAYAEIVFTQVYWPDFSKEHFIAALREFQNRERRFGRVKKR